MSIRPRLSSLAFTLILVIGAISVSTLMLRVHDPSIIGASGETRVYLPLALRVAPTPRPVPDAPWVAVGGVSHLGIWLGSGGNDAIEKLKEAGAEWTRICMGWSNIEPVETDPPTYDFSRYDSLLAALGNAGVNTIVSVQGNPGWAASTTCGPTDRKPERFGAFLHALVRHYKDAPYRVKHWEFYNEPENRVPVPWGNYLGGCFGDQPDKYVDMLRTASTAIKEVDPNAKVVFGGLAFGQYYDANLGKDIFNTSFFDQALAQGAGSYFDVANLHYFSEQGRAYISYGQDIAGKVGMIRQIMANHGVSKPLLITELSYTENNTAPDYLELQARYVPKVLARGLSIDLYAMTWFTLSENWDAADRLYGLMNKDLTPRPAYSAYQTAVAEFGRADWVRPLVPADIGGLIGVEGYVFLVGKQERWVLWADNEQKQITLPARAYEARDKFGQFVPLPNAVGDSPTYVHLTQ